MEAYESVFGTLDDEKAQAPAWTENEIRKNALSDGKSQSRNLCALEGGMFSDGWMMEAE